MGIDQLYLIRAHILRFNIPLSTTMIGRVICEPGCKENGNTLWEGTRLYTKFRSFSGVRFIDFPWWESCVALSIISHWPLAISIRSFLSYGLEIDIRYSLAYSGTCCAWSLSASTSASVDLPLLSGPTIVITNGRCSTTNKCTGENQKSYVYGPGTTQTQ